MFKRTTLLRAVILAMAVTAAWAADLTGKWSAQMDSPQGAMSMTVQFKQSGEKLTGTIDGPGGEPMEIQDGKVTGDKISFNVSFNGMKIAHEGIIKGDEIMLTIKMDGGGPGGDGPGPMTLKRVK